MEKVLNSNIKLIKPLGYLDFIKLLKHSKKIITDSGGVQKEAYIFKIPCITLRETEWIETVEEGWNIIVDINEKKIVDVIKNFEPNQAPKNFLGDGKAYKNIASIINELKT